MVDIIGRAKVIAETVIEEQQAKKAGKKAGEAAADGVAEGGKDAGKKFGDNFQSVSGGLLSKAALGLGVAAGTAVAVGIGQSLQRDATGKKFAASLGLDAADAAELNKSAAKIYRENWGESFEAVQKGVAATKSSFRGLSGQELTDAAMAAQIFADIFEVDVVEAAGVASVAVKQGLAKDAVEAFDLMTAAAQQVPLQFRSELLEAITEYSSFFESIGIDGPEAFALLAEGAALGQYGIDKVGDSIKEFQIRAIDSSATTADAFKTLGLDIEEMQTAIASGGDVAEAAFRKIVEAIASIEDPAAQSQAAIALFGTPLEDLSQEELPAFVEALANGSKGLDDFKGSTEEAGKVASDTFTSKAKGWGRSLNVYLGDTLNRIARLNRESGQEWGRWADNVGDAVDRAIDKLRDLADAVPNVDPGPVNQGRDLTIDDLLGGQGTDQFAGGVRNFSGGLAVVGETGAELVRLPAGSDVYSNSESQRMLASAGGSTFELTQIFTGPNSLAEARREADWARTYGTRFGSATSAGAL